MIKKKKDNRGGKREGSGRPAKKPFLKRYQVFVQFPGETLCDLAGISKSGADISEKDIEAAQKIVRSGLQQHVESKKFKL